MSGPEEGFDPDELREMSARLGLVAAEGDIKELAEITAQIAETVIGLVDSIKAVGEVSFGAARSVEALAARLDEIEGNQ